MSEEDFRDKTAIAGIGYSRSPETPGGFSRNSGVSVLTLAVRAATQAAEDAGIDPRDIDGCISYHVGDSVPSQTVLDALGVRSVGTAIHIQGGGVTSALSVMTAAEAVYHGVSKYCLVFRAMNGRSGIRMGQGGGNAGAGTGRVGGAGQFTSIYGMAGPPSMFAFLAQRYMALYGVTSLDFAKFAVNARNNAQKNPRAIMYGRPLTIEDHQNSRMIAHPYHLMDCCQETDVSVAVIVTTAERARELKKRPVLISGAIGGSGPMKENFHTDWINKAPRLLESAGVELKDIDFAELYDQFTGNPFYLTEDIGWCKRGEAKDFFQDGHIDLDGDVPMQTHGGLMNEGYAHGMNHCLEATQQLRGEAEDLCPNWRNGEHTYDRNLCRQVKNAELGLWSASMGNSGLILKRG